MVRHGPKCLQGPLFLSLQKWASDSAPNSGADSDSAVSPRSSGGEPAPSDNTIRWELVHRVRWQIAEGTYETTEKWEAALDALLEQLGA